LNFSPVDLKAVGLSDGRFVITWRSFFDFSVGFLPYSCWFDQDGNVLADPAVIGYAGHAYEPVIAPLGDGYVASWIESIPDRSQIKAVVFGGRDSVRVPEFTVATTTGDQTGLAVASLVSATPTSVVAWAEDPKPSIPSAIKAQRFAVDGTPLGPELTVGTATSIASIVNGADIAALPDGGFVVVWHSDRKTPCTTMTSTFSASMQTATRPERDGGQHLHARHPGRRFHRGASRRLRGGLDIGGPGRQRLRCLRPALRHERRAGRGRVPGLDHGPR
jgi:hypothetical protein